jgi:hypothetical protein
MIEEMKFLYKYFAPLALSFFAIVSAESVQAQVLNKFYTGVREMSMGGVYTGVVDDETAVLTNPAGLGKLRDVTWTIVDPELEGSFSDTNVTTTSNATTVVTAQGLLDALNNEKGTYWRAKAQVFPSIVAPNFGFGVNIQYNYDAMVDSTGTNYTLNYRRDVAPALGYCLRFFGGILKIGVAGRVIDRTEVDQTLPANSKNLSMDTLSSEGLGAAGDVGVILAAPVAMLPSLSAVVHDIGDTSYSLSSGMFLSTKNRPPDTPETIDVGFSIFPILSNNSRMSIAFDYDDVSNVYQTTDSMKRIHAGLEFNIHDFFFIRGGMNQRYWTAGVELASERFQLQAGSYGEEIGTTAAPKEDRRWIGKFSLRF